MLFIFISYQAFLGTGFVLVTYTNSVTSVLVNRLNSFTQEYILKEKKEQEEREQKLKKMIVEEKIHNWLQMKREQVNKGLFRPSRTKLEH